MVELRFSLLQLFLAATWLGAARGAETVDYVRQIKPIFARCVACHGALAQEAELRVDTAALAIKGGVSGAAIVPGDSGASLLIQAVSGNSDMPLMPKEGQPLSESEIALLKQWINEGALSPADEPIPDDPRRHWSFQSPARPAIPEGDDNPIDRMLAADHVRIGLSPLGQADKQVELRRVYLDLIGIPPTREQWVRYAADEAPDAYERQVDALLASPQYGQRWARHWMDIWRYSDWDGHGAEVRESKPHIWRWRDWIVDSVNADAPYDSMVRDMLAADEIAPEDPRRLAATGFLVRNWHRFNRNTWLDNTVEHTAKAFLGLTINCARCHDHKYDPFPQMDYYRIRAIFEPYQVRMEPVDGELDLDRSALARAYDADVNAPTYRYLRGDESRPDKEHPVSAGWPTMFGGEFRAIPVSLSPAAYYPGLRLEVQTAFRARALSELRRAEEELQRAEAPPNGAAPQERAVTAARIAARRAQIAAKAAALAACEARIAADDSLVSPQSTESRLPAAANLAERVEKHAVARANLLELQLQSAEITASGLPAEEAAKKSAELAPRMVEAEKSLAAAAAALGEPPSDQYARLSEVYPTTSSGRRSALASWIVARENPLTARVAVNHVWLRHFGAPLVPTVFDLGRNGQPPWNQEILDWLAVEFMESGWRMKPLHRLIVTSRAYRRASSGAAAANEVIDRDNVHLWKMNVRRMEAEAVRDSVLAIAGELDCALGGPDIEPSQAFVAPRRSIYFRTAKEKRVEFLAQFDSPNVLECYRRQESVVPQQALTMTNSSLTQSAARKLAGKLSVTIGESLHADAEFVDAAFETVLSRRPTEKERDACLQFIQTINARLSGDASQLHPLGGTTESAVLPSADAHQRAREDLVHVLFNHNDFVTIR